jgi:hypothetical protein
MAALIEQLPPLMFLASSAIFAPGDAETWSHERLQSLQLEAVAKLHFASRVSSHAYDEGDEPYDFEAIPLVATRTVRVTFQHVGPMPPMNLEDEITGD